MSNFSSRFPPCMGIGLAPQLVGSEVRFSQIWADLEGFLEAKSGDTVGENGPAELQNLSPRLFASGIIFRGEESS